MPHEALHLEPVRTPLGWPVSSDLLAPFCHPQDGHPFSRPFTIDGITHAANGWLALKLDTPEPRASRPQPNPTAASRLAALECQWGTRGVGLDMDPERPWRKLDAKGGAIWRQGPLPFWGRSAGQWRACLDPRVIVGHRSVPLALIHLIARLPRAEIWTYNPMDCRLTGGCHIPFRFNGGHGTIARWLDSHAGDRGWHLFGFPKGPDNRTSFGPWRR